MSASSRSRRNIEWLYSNSMATQPRKNHIENDVKGCENFHPYKFSFSRPALRRSLWLNSLLLDVSPPSVCAIFRRGISASQKKKKIYLCPGLTFVVYGWNNLPLLRSRQCAHLTARDLLKMTHTDGGETSSKRDFIYILTIFILFCFQSLFSLNWLRLSRSALLSGTLFPALMDMIYGWNRFL